MEPTPYIDEKGQRFYNVRQAAQIVGCVCVTTMWNWASEGKTKFGFKLHVRSEPITQHRAHRSDEAPPVTHRKYRMLIPETDVVALKDIFEIAGKKDPGPWSPSEMSTLERVAASYPRRAAKFGVFHL